MTSGNGKQRVKTATQIEEGKKKRAEARRRRNQQKK